MKKSLNNFFTNWELTIIIWLLGSILLAFTLRFENIYYECIAFIFFGIGLLIVLISSIYHFFRKSWMKGFLNLLIIGFSIVGFIFYSVILFFKSQSEPDLFGKNLKIPKNIQIEKPVGLNAIEEKSIDLNVEKKSIDFQLYDSFQPGIYKYDFWINRIEEGTIYLRAYEITNNIPLSKEKLYEKSSLHIVNQADSIKKFSAEKDFTIYEGDWGDYYAARFEVWFKPKNGKIERKLFQKNYIIEGWMR